MISLTEPQRQALQLVKEGKITWRMTLNNPKQKEGYRVEGYWQAPSQPPYRKLELLGLIHKPHHAMRPKTVTLTAAGEKILEELS